MHLHRKLKTVGYTSCLRSESNKGLFLELGPFSRKSFSRKNWVGGWWRLDEVIEPSLQPVCSRAQEVVPVAPTPIEVEADDGDHRASDQVTTSLVGWQGRVLLQSGTVTLSWRSCCWATVNLRVMEKAMVGPDSDKWLEAMKSERGSMYENKV